MNSGRFIGNWRQQEHQLFVVSLGGGRYEVTLDGKAHQVDAQSVGGGNISLLINGLSYDVELEVSGAHESEGGYNTLVRGEVVSAITVQDERRLRISAASKKLESGGPPVVASPMPGKVIKVLVRVGEVVHEGQPLVIIEAMKMENELCAPIAGEVAEIHIEQGQAVEAKASLITLR